MTGLIPLARRIAFCGVFLCVLQSSRAVLGGPCLLHSCSDGCKAHLSGGECLTHLCCWGTSPDPCSKGCICIPNVQGFGYFHTQWRHWPAERRPDIYFPRSVGAEELPTPEGEKQLPPSAGPALPGEPPPDGGILPPDQGLGSPFLPEPPVEVPEESATPPTEPPVELPTEPPVELPAEPPEELPTEPSVELPTEPPVELPAEPPVELPAEPAVELPAEPPVELPAEPAVELPAEPPVELPAEPPSEASEEADALRPLLKNAWGSLAAEQSRTRPLLERSLSAHSPAA